MSSLSRTLFGAAVLVSLATAGYWWWSSREGHERPGPSEAVRLAVIANYPGTALYFLAQAKGYFAAEGLEAALQSHPSGKATMKALAADAADFAAAGDIPIMLAVTKGGPLAILATISTASRDQGVWSAEKE